MSVLKKKLLNKKSLFFIILALVLIIICVFLIKAKKEKDTSNTDVIRFTNVYANVSTSAIKGYEDEVEEFLNLAKENAISFESENEENCYNITPDFVKENSNYKIFKFQDTAETYIVYENNIYKIGNNKRERGTTSFALADINDDGILELFYTYIWQVSNVSRTNISYFDPLTKKEVGINENYVENCAILIKKDNDLIVCDGTISNEYNNTNFNVNSRTENAVLINDKGTVKPIKRFLFNEIFSE